MSRSGCRSVAAVTEDDLTSHVTRGENASRLLHHDAVVRSMQPVKTLTLGSGQQTSQVPVPLNSGWRRRNLNVVVFVQARTSRHIVGAELLPLGRM
ncbi:MAG: DUF1223 domain-containing protein [Rhodanobacteraceae bacterium]|nr:MAG: DUF1223 domain-containing protein [Rhodanobacteraceae bacterium]